jgi:sugar phosphate isomerase/epimerase
MASVQRAVKYGRLRQSLTYWCLNTDWNWDIDRICLTAKDLGCESVELVPPEMWPAVRKHGLQSALAPNGMPDPPFHKGVNNPKYHDEVIARTKHAIDQASNFGFPNVITFIGYKWRDSEDPKSGEIRLQKAQPTQ